MKRSASFPYLIPLGTFFGGSFLLHLLWENAQAPLFQGFESFAQHFPICLKATATGDMLFMLVIYCTLALVHQDMWWPGNPKTYRPPATWILPPFIGVLLAISFELWAIHVANRWTYATTMPILPLLQIGIPPLVQMMLIPILSLFIASRSIRHL